MRDFFKGWKRKGGFVTLVLACVFAAAWFRSLNNADVVRFRVFRYRRTVYSIDGQLHWRWWLGMRRTFNVRLSVSKATVAAEMDSERDSNDMDRYNRGGSLRGTLSTDDCYRETVIPYWSVAAPLVLLSAYLLLSKPRPVKTPGPSQPPEPEHA